MRTPTISLVVILLACCPAQCSVSKLAFRRIDDSVSLLRGRSDDAGVSMQRRYEEARKLASEALRSGKSRDLDVGRSRIRDGAPGETWGVEKMIYNKDTCDVSTLKQVDECGCKYTKELRKMNGELEERCETALDKELDAMDGSCSPFEDIGGRFKVVLLKQKMQETLQSCSVSESNTVSLRTEETIQNVDRIPCSPQICELLNLLQALNRILKNIFGSGSGPSPGSRRLVSAKVYRGYSPKAARLMVYNNISVLPAAQSS